MVDQNAKVGSREFMGSLIANLNTELRNLKWRIKITNLKIKFRFS